MKVEISDYYKSLGYNRLYVNTNKEPRRVANLYGNNVPIKCMSYAKYLYTSHYACSVPDGYEVDHINGDKMDDRIENLQIINGTYNRQKDKKISEKVIKICPICGCEFLMDKRNEKFRPNATCSKKCGNIKKSQLLLNRDKYDISKETLENLLAQNLTRQESAKRLGVSTNTFRKYLKKYNLL